MGEIIDFSSRKQLTADEAIARERPRELSSPISKLSSLELVRPMDKSVERFILTKTLLSIGPDMARIACNTVVNVVQALRQPPSELGEPLEAIPVEQNHEADHGPLVK